MRLCCVVGARPNFMKIAPVFLELRRRGLKPVLVHTGQHYDENMSSSFLAQLGLPRPAVALGVGPGSHAAQTARVMSRFEPVCLKLRPELVVVGGDVNSTLGAALAAAKLGVPVAHVEAGLRSFDRGMPEELNRVLTDHVSELLFTTEASAGRNLAAEGIPGARVRFVGNCMVDSLLKHLPASLGSAPWRGFGLAPGTYALVTLHRPSNVDDDSALKGLADAVSRLSRRLPVVFPAHPRTAPRLRTLRIRFPPAVRLAGPLPYLRFLGLMARARLVLTDSGGIQEETTALSVPCLTVRDNTERPVTIERGTNTLAGTDPEAVLRRAESALEGRIRPRGRPPLWDGRAGARIADAILGWRRRAGGSA